MTRPLSWQSDYMNYDKLKMLIECVPIGLDKKLKKESINRNIRTIIEIRDNEFPCPICERENIEMHIHHIIPNGKATEDNLISLCNSCHAVIHTLLYVSGKWKYIPATQLSNGIKWAY